MFGTKPTFGATSTGFGGGGFGTATAPFGQSTFGNKPSAFGSPSFGTSSPSLFGAPNTTASGIFGTNTSAGFGGFGTTTTSGGGLFGSQPTQSQSGSLFGSGASAFGTQNKTGFGFNPSTSTSGGGLFGQAPQQQPSLFGQPQTSTGTGGLFGSTVSGFGTGQGVTGTTIKFNPVTSSDTMVKNGQTQHINTRHQCVTCMKEYETKSLEELRLEDYSAGRKSGAGNQLGMGFGGATSQPSSGLFGTNTSTTGGLFGSPTQNKPLFGGTNTFGPTTSGGGLFGPQQTQSGGLFNKPVAFGTPTTSTSTGFGFNNNNNTTGGGLFGSTTQNKPLFGAGTFNQTSQAPAFGGSTFGSTSFGQQTQPSNTLFGQQQKPFGSTFTSTSSSFGFGNPSTSSTGLFGNTTANKPAFNFGGTTSTTGFGTNTSTTGGLFSQKPGNFSFPTSNTFNTPSFGNTGTSLFGNTQNKPGGLNTGFGNTSFNFGGGLGTSTTTPGFNFGGSSFGGFGGQQPQQQQQAPGQMSQVQQQILAMATNPYGDSPLFKNMLKETGKRQEMLKLNNSPAGKSLSSAPKVANPTPALKPKPVYTAPTKQSLFEGLDKNSESLSPKVFLPKPGFRQLFIKPKKEEPKKSPEAEDPAPVTPKKDPPPPVELITTDILGSLEEPSPSILVAKTVPQEGQSRETSALDDTIINLNIKKKQASPVNKSKEEAAENEENEEPHPTGIRLRRAGYYCVPSLEDLLPMMDGQGRIEVEGFLIGRTNYGSVYFPDKMDVANLDLDEIVHLRRREILLYPDDDKKPPVGEGLNRPAQITLDGVWPTDKATREPITDPRRIEDMRYAEKIENATYKKGATFLEYRPESGSWVFEVPHF